MLTLGSLKNKKFTSLQAYFWPVLPHETKLVLYLACFVFLIWTMNTSLSSFRDSLLITAPNSGAQVIGFLRLCGVLPMGILFIILYSWLINKFKRHHVINIFYGASGIFYLLYAFVIYPHHTSLIVNPATIAQLMKEHPHIQWIFPIFGNWTISLFFVITDLWVSVSLSQFFWQTANAYTKTDQASRFYPLFMAMGGLASVIAAVVLGSLMEYIEASHRISFKKDFALQAASLLNVVLCLMAMFVFNKFYRYASHLTPPKKLTSTSPSPSAFDGFRYLLKSNYLFYIFLTLLASELIYALITFLWKTELQIYTSNTIIYDELFSRYAFWGGITLILTAYGTKTFIQYFGWVKVSYFSPMISLITAIPFFGMLLFHHLKGSYDYSFGINPHYFLAMLGAFQSICMTATFASFYYPTKEMAYIPLDVEMRSKGKAATDVLGSNCGKAISGIIQEGFLSITGTIDLTVIPYLLAVTFGLFGMWFYATKALGKKYIHLLMSAQKKD